MSVNVTLSSTGKTYQLPSRGEVDWAALTSYLKDVAGALNNSSGSGVTGLVVNVKNYGAKGDGVTNDTTALAAARAAVLTAGVAGGALYFPAGTYVYSSTLQFGVAGTQANVRIVGDGASSILKPTGAFSGTPAIEFRNVSYWRVTDVVVDGADYTGSGDLLLIDGCSNGTATRSTFKHSARYGINITKINGSAAAANNSVFDNTYASNASGDVSPRESLQTTLMVNLRDPRYGAVGDGVADDTAAVQAWVNAVCTDTLTGTMGFAPKGEYKITGQITFPNTRGATFAGAGDGTNFVWAGTAGQKMFFVKPGQFCNWRDFRVSHTDASKHPLAVFWMSNPGDDTQVYAITGHTFTNVNIEGPADSFDYGIYWEDTYGNASEIKYFHVTMTGPKEAGVILPGTQQKSHNFYGCEFAVGKIGVRVGGGIANPGQGGSFNWYGGGIGSMTYSAFTVEFGSDPIEIQGCQSEHCVRFLDTIAPGAAATPTRGIVPVTIRGCRLDTAADSGLGISPQYASYIRLMATGPFTIENNTFHADSPLRIQLGTATTSLKLEGNFFSQPYTTSPLNYDDGAGVTRFSDVRMAGNRFTNLAGNEPDWQRYEGLDVAPASEAAQLISQSGNRYLVALPPPTAAATTQSLLVVNLSLGVRLKPVGALIYNRFALSGTPDIFLSVGTSSGGQELMLEQKVSVADGERLGLTTAEWGSLMVPEGVVPSYFGVTPLYVTWRSASGNLGTGTANSFTGGLGFLILEAEQDARWLHNS